MTSSEPTLSFWHGAQRWSGQPELRPARPKSYECGPGLYLTNQLGTARKYAKGGGQTVLVTLAADLVLLEDVRLPLNTLLEGLESLPRVRGRKEIANRLKEAAHRFEDQTLPAAYLLNNCIYNDALGGETGPALARWFTEQGIDASRYDKLGGEDWLVIFNLAKVKKTRIMTSNQAYELGSFPTLPEQRLAGAEPAAAEEPPAPRSLRMR